jgi:putative phosphoesterase
MVFVDYSYFPIEYFSNIVLEKKLHLLITMKRIGLLSDTHGFLDPKIWDYFADVDEVWHAGDIGDMAMLEALEKFKPLRVVFGNIDNHIIRSATKEFLRFRIEAVDVLMTHIAGRPGKYAKPALEALQAGGAPQLFVCGHSHIALAQFDKRYNMLWLNPGACGYKGFHQVKTIFRFSITHDKIHDLECIELGPRIGKSTEHDA